MNELTLFPDLSPQGLMYLQLPDLDPRLTKTDIKIGFSRNLKTQRRRDTTHRKISPSMSTVATWRASHEEEQAFHLRNQADVMPGKREWYFPTLKVVQAIRTQLVEAKKSDTLAFQSGWTMELALESLHTLFATFDRHQFLMTYQWAQDG
jgi:hypothetical protein